jgi:hypothetical protein
LRVLLYSVGQFCGGVDRKKEEKADGLQRSGASVAALHRYHQGGRALPRLCMLGRPSAAVREPRRQASHRPAGARLYAAAPHALRAVYLSGIRLATPSGRRSVPLARPAAPLLRNCGGHAPLATVARSPRVSTVLAHAARLRGSR